MPPTTFRPSPSSCFCASLLFADFLVPFYLNRQFNLYIDSVYLPDLRAHCSTKACRRPSYGLIRLAALVFLLCVGLYKSLAVIHGFFRHPYGRRLFWGTSGMLFLVIAGFHHFVAGKTSSASAFAVMQRVTEEVRFTLEIS